MNQKILALMIISIMWMQTTVAAIDAMELAMLKPYQDKPILYWDSVVGEPLSIEDQASQNYSLLDYMSGDQQKIRLHQGMQKRFYLPAYERIRLYNPDRQLKQNDIIAYVSNGSGLLAKASGYLSKDGHSFIISPQSSIPLIVDIQISDSEDKDHKTLDLDVLISRRELLNQLAPYPDLQWLAGQHVWLQSSFLAPQPYWTMLPYQPHYLSLQGPARIQLKHRFQYEQHATALFQDYRISYRLDDQPPRVLDFRTGAESSSQTRVNMQTQTLGRVLQTYLEIPPGQHRLELVADRTVYVQVLKQTENIYLLPWLNQPQLTLQQVRENNQLAQQLLLEMNALAQFMVRDNGRKASALTAQSLFEKAALQHSYYPQALADVRKLGGQYTFYRDLLPAVKQSSEDQFTAYFITKTLRAIRTRQEDPVLSKQHQSAALKRLGYAYFSPVAKKPGVDRYLLPNRLVETRIRLIADKRLCTQRRFYIQMDQLPPRSFILRCQENTNTDYDFVKSLSETALENLQQHSELADNITLAPLFAAYRKPAPLISVAVTEMILPAHIHELSIWTDDDLPQALNLALQIRSAKPYLLSEQSYLSRLYEASKSHLFNVFVTDLGTMQKHSNPTQQQLLNQWLPIKRDLIRHYRDYKNSVSNVIHSVVPVTPVRLKKWHKQARNAEQQQQWVEALQFWNKIVHGTEGEVRDHAQLAQANILYRLSENYLAKTLWRYLTLYAQNNVAEQAKQQLLTEYTREHNEHAIVQLAAAMFVHRPDLQRMDSLIQAYMQNQQYRFALLLGLTFTEVVPERMLTAAYQLGWWQTYDNFVAQLPKQQQIHWLALKAQRQGDVQVASQIWSENLADQWYAYLQSGLLIQQHLKQQRQLNYSKQKDRNKEIIQIYQDWRDWQKAYPGQWIWKDASQAVRDAAGTDSYYSVERDFTSKAYRTKPERTVKLQILGPAKLAFQIRILHQQLDAELDGWIRIVDNKQSYSYPFFHNKPVQGLEITGQGDYLPGNLITLDYQVGDGYHEIELSAFDAPMSIVIKRQYPEIPLTVLAPLQINTFIETLRHTLKLEDVTDRQLLKLIPHQPSTSLAMVNRALSLESLQALPETVDSSQASIRMMEYLMLLENDPDSRQSVLFLAEQLQYRYRNNTLVQSIWNKMSRYQQWQTVHSIVNSGGERFVEINGWQPVTPKLRIRKALLSETSPQQHVITGGQHLLMVMKNLTTRLIQVEAYFDDVGFLPDSSASVVYQIDQLDPQHIEMTRSQNWKQFQVRVPAGQHQLRFTIQHPVANQFLKLRFRNAGTTINDASQRTFFVSTQNSPLQVYINGPTVIRVDEWVNNKIISQLQTVPVSGWQLVTIPPDKKQQQALFQVRQQIPVSERKEMIKSRSAKRILQPVLPALAQFDDLFSLDQLKSFDRLENSLDNLSSGFGTWSFGTDTVRRNNVLEDSTRSGPVHYQQFRLDHRYFDEFSNTYWDTQGFVRHRQHGSPSFGLNEFVRIQPRNWPFRINLSAKLVTQQVAGELEWTGLLKTAVSKTVYLTPRTRVIPQISWFGRYMSLRNRGKLFPDGAFKDRRLTKKVDQDLYTIYKSEHTRGLAASLLLIHEPWMDTRWTAKVNSVSNEDLNFFIPDHVSTEAHWKQLFGNLDLDASVRVNFYQDDNNRSSSIRRHFTKLELNWQNWSKKQNRFEISGQYNYDIDRNEHLGMLSFTYHYGEHRGYRDFKRSAVNFRNIRERQRLDGYN